MRIENRINKWLARLMLALLALLALLPVLTSPTAQAANDPVPEMVLRHMQSAGVPALALLQLRPGAVPKTYGFGRLTQEGDQVNGDSVFQAASLGKVAAAYAALRLIEQGKLSLDAPLADPRLVLGANCKAPTVRHILTHTSGLGNNLEADRFPVSCGDGVTFRYSGQGFMLLAAEMERVTGVAAPQLIADLVFRPLGMNHTAYGTPAAAPNQARGHISMSAYVIGQAIGKPFQMIGLAVILTLVLLLLVLPLWQGRRHGGRRAGLWLLSGLFDVAALIYIGTHWQAPAERALAANLIPASMVSSINDLGRLVQELQAPRLISPQTANLLAQSEIKVSDCVGWNLMMGTDRCGGQPTVWQWGANLGFQSLMVLQPETGAGVVILTNSGGGLDSVLPGQGGYPAAKRIASELLGIQGRWDLR